MFTCPHGRGSACCDPNCKISVLEDAVNELMHSSTEKEALLRKLHDDLLFLYSDISLEFSVTPKNIDDNIHSMLTEIEALIRKPKK